MRVDDISRLLVRPRTHEFSMIFRSGMEVHWDAEAQSLYSPPPREWDHLRWYQQIAGAVASEYGQRLALDSQTVWKNVAPDLKDKILAWSASWAP